VDRLGLPLRRKVPYRKPAKGRVAFLNPREIRPDIEGRPSPVRWIVFPQYVAGADPRLENLTRSQAAYELARQCFNFRVCQEQTLSRLADIVRQADCYRLTAGDLEPTCDLLESRLCQDARPKWVINRAPVVRRATVAAVPVADRGELSTIPLR
jgi:hypothetical protein